MTASILLDLSHTSHTQARTGVQRVARSLWRELGPAAQPICHDPYLDAWRSLESSELANLRAEAPGGKRGARWPWSARLRGLIRHRISRSPPLFTEGCLLVPEIFSPAVAAALPTLIARIAGPCAAVFHDAIALRFPELTPPGTVGRFPAYLQELLAFDGICAVSADSRAALLDYWRWLGVSDPPPVVTIPLGVDRPPPRGHASLAAETFAKPSDPSHQLQHAAPHSRPQIDSRPVVLCVGSIEGRKNHLALLEACERLWKRGMNFELRLVGLAQPETGKSALELIAELQRSGRPLRSDGAVDDRILEDAYAAAAFTVYPSLAEGFGLPVGESLARGKPCVCSGRGALGEAARGGGCVTLDTMDAGSLEAAIARLLGSPEELAALTAAARARPIRTWADYASEVSGWLQTLPRRRRG